MTVKKSNMSQVISWLRFPLIVLVVLVHCNFSTIDGGWGNLSLASNVTQYVSNVIAKICNPFFFFISGLLFFRSEHFNAPLYVNKLKRRFRSLFIPYMIWNSIFLFLILLLENVNPSHTAIINKPISAFKPIDYLFVFINTSYIYNYRGWGTPIDGPLWFVRDLMVIVVFSPIIYLIIKHALSRMHTSISIILACVLLLICDSGIFDFEWKLEPILFFTFGAFVSIKRIDLIGSLWKYTPVLWVVTIVLFFLKLQELSYFSAILCSFPTVSYLLRNNKIRLHPLLTESTFFIFASHELVQSLFCHMLRRKMIPFNYNIEALAFYVFSVIVITSISFLIFVFMRKYLPKATKLMIGGR